MQGGFTILEVVVALALFALIAVPAVGLAVMATKRNADALTAGVASELKNRIDVALRALIDADDDDDNILKRDLTSDPMVFLASENLLTIELLDEDSDTESIGYFRVEVDEPDQIVPYVSDATSPDTYRLVYYRITWPNNAPEGTPRRQLFATSVFRK